MTVMHPEGCFAGWNVRPAAYYRMHERNFDAVISLVPTRPQRTRPLQRQCALMRPRRRSRWSGWRRGCASWPGTDGGDGASVLLLVADF